MNTKIIALSLLSLAPAALWGEHVKTVGYSVVLSPSNQVRSDGSTVMEDSFGGGSIAIRAYRDPEGALTKAVVDFNINWQIRRPMHTVTAMHIHQGAVDQEDVRISVERERLSHLSSGGLGLLDVTTQAVGRLEGLDQHR